MGGTEYVTGDLLKRLEGRVDDLELRVGPSANSKERKQQIAEAMMPMATQLATEKTSTDQEGHVER